MKKTIFFLASFLAGFTAYSYDNITELSTKFKNILNTKTEVHEYNVTNLNTKHIKINSSFAKETLSFSKIQSIIHDSQIKHICYVYSKYKKEESFNQRELNKLRLKKLYSLYPRLFTDSTITWETVSQTNANNVSSARQLFHGFVIYYRSKPTSESIKKEISDIENILISERTKASSIHLEAYPDNLVLELETRIHLEKPLSEDEDDWGIDPSLPKTITKETYSYNNYFQDTLISSVLNRNKQWNHMLIACDLTGSMSPYSSQLLVWHRLNFDTSKIQHFAFFNDGNMKPDLTKIAGKTGGIYLSSPTNFNDVKKEVYRCMRNGYGGDAPENDIEALLKGLKKYPSSNDIILIADNWANMRDYRYIEKLNRPIKVILCGTQFGINTQYLELARKTGGSIHTIEEDITRLMDIKEGETITIGRETFKIKKGRFIKLKQS